MNCASALSTEADVNRAATEVLDRVARSLGDGGPADLALVFISKHHADALETIGAGIRRRGLGRVVLGCTGESIVGEGREIEQGPALSVWAARLPGVDVRPCRLTFEGGEFSSLPGEARAGLILLGDPFSFPADLFLKRVDAERPGTAIVGGMASGSQVPGNNRLLLDDEVFDDGAVAVELSGPVELRTIVSQGCRPIGRPMIVTKVEGNLIRELGRRPAFEVVRECFTSLTPDDRARVQNGLHIGRVINEYQETFGRGDFLVRNVLGADDSGAIAITDTVRVGQTVQFHVRDAETADEDLRGLLEAERRARPEGRVKGALLFSCNGRGSRLFDTPNHDAAALGDFYAGLPVAGFFAMGELGPVGGQNFVHGYTASVVLFEEPASPPG
jgi:small ligand-binding sensory domain FIST